MFSHEELAAMSRTAMEQLKEQEAQNAENNEYEGEDIYAGLMDDIDGTENSYEPSVEDLPYVGELPNLEHSGEEEELPTLDPFDEPLFPGGPGKNQIASWKKEWDGYDIYITEIIDKTFIFRTLNRFEYKQLVSLTDIDALQREEVICQTVTLWPPAYTWKEMATTLAGVPSTYAEIIMEKSGFTKDYAIQVI